MFYVYLYDYLSLRSGIVHPFASLIITELKVFLTQETYNLLLLQWLDGETAIDVL